MRSIICLECCALKCTKLDAEDRERGLTERRKSGRAIRELRCDECNLELHRGDQVVALSIPAHMAEWEHAYLK